MIYTVTGYQSTCEKAVRKKLLAFGLTPGTELKLVRTAPLGDPLELKVRGYSLSLRKAEFEQLVLKPKSCVHCKSCKV